MSGMSRGIGSYQLHLTKNSRKNTNSINLMSALNERSKLTTGTISEIPEGNFTKIDKEKKSLFTQNGKAGFFNNANFKLHTIKNLPQNRIKTPTLDKLQNEKNRNLRQSNKLSLEKGIRINRAQESSNSSHKKPLIKNNNFSSKKPSFQYKQIPLIPQLSFSHSSKCVFPKSKRVSSTEEAALSRKNTPGPGQYNLLSLQPRLSPKFGLDNRLPNKVNATPGPGRYSYQHSQLSKKGGVFFRQKRYTSCQSSTPGPAKYETVSLNKIRQSTACVIIHPPEGKKNEGKMKILPGPGQYSINQSSRNSRIRGGSIGKSRRELQKLQISPGPNIYSPKYGQVLTKSPTFVIGKEIRETSQTNKLRNTDNPRNSLSQDSKDFLKGLNFRSKSQIKKQAEYK